MKMLIWSSLFFMVGAIRGPHAGTFDESRSEELTAAYESIRRLTED
jgi:hypothetical protein